MWVSSSIALISKFNVASQDMIKKIVHVYNYSICSFPQVWIFYLWNILSWEHCEEQVWSNANVPCRNLTTGTVPESILHALWKLSTAYVLMFLTKFQNKKDKINHWSWTLSSGITWRTDNTFSQVALISIFLATYN